MDELVDPELQLLTRHLSGVTTPEEETRLREWLAEDPSHPCTLDALRSGWALSATLAPLRHDPDPAWARVTDRLEGRGAGRALGVEARPAAGRQRAAGWAPLLGHRAWRAAAVALVAAGAGALWATLHRAPSAAESAALVVEVPRGQETTVRLPDGSRVVLAPESRLRYPRSFGERSRDLQLEGMGYFEVARDAGRPFQVHAGGGTARVLGTKFVVRAYPDATRVEVAVTEGSVALRADSVPPERALALTPGQIGRLDDHGVARVESASAAHLYLGWMDGHPVVRDLPLPEVLDEIERWYDVKLAIGDPRLASRRITTTIERASLNETLAVIALALDARYVTRGDTLVFLQNR